jgi:hypothetical protein
MGEVLNALLGAVRFFDVHTGIGVGDCVVHVKSQESRLSQNGTAARQQLWEYRLYHLKSAEMLQEREFRASSFEFQNLWQWPHPFLESTRRVGPER